MTVWLVAAYLTRQRARNSSNDRSRRRSRLPGVGQVERLFAEFLAGPGDRTAAERSVEFDRRLVVRQDSHHEAANLALSEVTPDRREQPAPEAEALELRPQVKLVDLAVIGQAARAVAPVIRVARNRITERQDRDTAALANGAFPPFATMAAIPPKAGMMLHCGM
jgi:hypothetical protein